MYKLKKITHLLAFVMVLATPLSMSKSYASSHDEIERNAPSVQTCQMANCSSAHEMNDEMVSAYNASRFTDVSPNAWYYKAVEEARKSGYMSGYPDGRFRPNQTVTRAECAVIIDRIVPTKLYLGAMLVDVDDHAWYSDGVNGVANALGGCYVDTSKWIPTMDISHYDHPIYFYPNKPCIRQDFAVGLYNVLNLNSVGSWKAHFTDIDDISQGDENYNYRQAACSMINTGLMSGYGDPGSTEWYFRPKKTITRAEIAQILYNYKYNYKRP